MAAPRGTARNKMLLGRKAPRYATLKESERAVIERTPKRRKEIEDGDG